MGSDGLKDLVSPSGVPLSSEPRIILIKVPKHIKLHPGMIQNLGKATGCSVITLPMDCEMMMGKIAQDEIESMHAGIHAILGVPNIQFNAQEVAEIQDCVRRNEGLYPGWSVTKLVSKLDSLNSKSK